MKYMPSGKRFYMTALTLTTGAANNYFLISDASGNASWTSMAPPMPFSSGTSSAPGITFIADGTTGLYYSSGTLGFAVSATAVMTATSSGFTLENGKSLSVGTSGTTSPLTVYGLITANNGLTVSSGTSSLQAATTAGLLTANAGITVATGQTLNVGTSGTISPLNAYGLITANNGLTVAIGSARMSGSASTTTTSATLAVTPPTYTTANTNNVYMSYFSGASITTSGGVPAEAYTVYIDSPPTGATDNYNLYVNGGRTYLNSGIRNRVTTISTTPYTATYSDYILVHTFSGAKTITLPTPVAPGAVLIFANTITGTLTVESPGTDTIDGSTTNKSVGVNASLMLVGITTTGWISF